VELLLLRMPAPLVECSSLNVQLLVCACSLCRLGTDFAHVHDINGSCSCVHERVGPATDTDCSIVDVAWYFSTTSSVQTSEAELCAEQKAKVGHPPPPQIKKERKAPPDLQKSFKKHLFHH